VGRVLRDLRRKRRAGRGLAVRALAAHDPDQEIAAEEPKPRDAAVHDEVDADLGGGNMRAHTPGHDLGQQSRGADGRGRQVSADGQQRKEERGEPGQGHARLNGVQEQRDPGGRERGNDDGGATGAPDTSDDALTHPETLRRDGIGIEPCTTPMRETTQPNWRSTGPAGPSRRIARRVAAGGGGRR
jgi:hypothetical protein